MLARCLLDYIGFCVKRVSKVFHVTSINVCRYSTGLGVTGGSALIHEFYSREVPNPIHLTVDTGFNNGEGTIKAYVSSNLSLGDRQLAAQFQEVPLDLRMVEAERVGCKIQLNTLLPCKIVDNHCPQPFPLNPKSLQAHILNICIHMCVL